MIQAQEETTESNQGSPAPMASAATEECPFSERESATATTIAVESSGNRNGSGNVEKSSDKGHHDDVDDDDEGDNEDDEEAILEVERISTFLHKEDINKVDNNGSARELCDMNQDGLQQAYSYYGYEDAVHTTQRGSSTTTGTVDRVMTWAGAVNQEMFNAEHLRTPCYGNGYAAQSQPHQHQQHHRQANRRASADPTERPQYVEPISSFSSSSRNAASSAASGPVRRRAHSSDETDWDVAADAAAIGNSRGNNTFLFPEEEEEERIRVMNEEYYYYEDGDDDDRYHSSTESHHARAARRNSLQAVVEKAVSMINVDPNREPDDLCPFGTRRDSLF